MFSEDRNAPLDAALLFSRIIVSHLIKYKGRIKLILPAVFLGVSHSIESGFADSSFSSTHAYQFYHSLSGKISSSLTST